MFRPITYAPRGRMSHSVATLSASLARGSPMCQPCSSRPRLPRGASRLWFGPATKPSSEIDMWQVVSGTANLLNDCDFQAVVRTLAGDVRPQVQDTGWGREVRPIALAPRDQRRVDGDRRPLLVLRDVVLAR